MNNFNKYKGNNKIPVHKLMDLFPLILEKFHLQIAQPHIHEDCIHLWPVPL
jgi:hypothetical protein